MTNRLKFILVFGFIAIALTYVLTRTPGEVTSDVDAQQEQQLAMIREKQRAKLAAARDSLAGTTESSGASTNASALNANPLSSAPALTENIKQHVTSTIEQFKNLMPSASKPPSEPVDTQTRISYLQTMPVSVIEATRRQDAANLARQEAGRENPFAELAPANPFPRRRAGSQIAAAAAGKLPNTALGSGPEGLPLGSDLPPPPPPEVTAELNPPPGISSDELPPPPEKPLLMRKLKLNGIVGDRVILAFKDRHYQQAHGYKRFITLAQGQVFDDVKVVDVEQDKAVLEEDGQQTIVRLDPIR
jgi:hypothetical protein